MKLSCEPSSKKLQWYGGPLSVEIQLSVKEALVLALAIEQGVEIELSVSDPTDESEVLATVISSGWFESEDVMVGYANGDDSRVLWATEVDRENIVKMLRQNT